MEFIRAWFREDLNSAIAELVVFRRKWILIDSDFADGVFRRKLATAESIDKDGTAARPADGPANA